jgi:uncharacterized protein
MLKYFSAGITLFLFLCTVFFSINAAAITYPHQPTQDSFIVDEAGIIDPNATKEINTMIFQLWNEQQIPLYVVTIPSLSTYDAPNYSINQYATELFNHWGIGSQTRNYGILLLVSKGDRKARIEFGEGYGNKYDSQANKIMQTLIIPNFKNSNYSLGVTEGVRGLTAVARGLNVPEPKTPWWVLPLLIGAIVLIVCVIISLFRSGRTGWGWMLLIALGSFIAYMLYNTFKGGGSGGSGGGFGGGSSGGGGATGSW